MSINTENQQFIMATYAEKIFQAKTTPKEFLDFLATVTKNMRSGAHPIDDPTTSKPITREGMENIIQNHAKEWMRSKLGGKKKTPSLTQNGNPDYKGGKKDLKPKILIQMNPKNSKTKMCGDPQKKN